MGLVWFSKLDAFAEVAVFAVAAGAVFLGFGGVAAFVVGAVKVDADEFGAVEGFGFLSEDATDESGEASNHFHAMV